jgi:hypothetical protein
MKGPCLYIMILSITEVSNIKTGSWPYLICCHPCKKPARIQVRCGLKMLQSAVFIGDAVPPFRVNPIDVVVGACDPARAAFDAVFIRDGRQLLLFVPIVHIGRAKVIAVLRGAFQTVVPFLND